MSAGSDGAAALVEREPLGERFHLFAHPLEDPDELALELARRGVMSAECRLPLCEMTEANAARLRTTLDAFEANA